MSTNSVTVPDIGDFKDVPVIEIHVKVGDQVKLDDPLVSLESDKATMEVPAPFAGRVAKVLVKIGDKVSEGAPLVLLENTEASGSVVSALSTPAASKQERSESEPSTIAASNSERNLSRLDFTGVHASPAVRRLARELDIDLTRIKGSGEHGRVTKDDVKGATSGGSAAVAGTAGIPEIPAQDFAKFGSIETKPLSRLKKLSGPHLHRAWLNIPHVTHADEADITDIEAYRKMLDAAAKEKGYRVTLLAFLLKACVVVLKEHPEFNASPSPSKDTLILKRYYHIGVAVDTPDGLVVPVIRDVDHKGIVELCLELASLSQRMRDGKIAPADIQGATFSISSLGGIGGTSFTPIVNAPEIAILGVVRAAMKPMWDGQVFQPRLMLPLCLSYDHRVIDGALAARFARRLADILADVRQLIL
ncbi:2-oxo acid dehydrogenase subunit E2 [Bradyrhizobium sp. BR13661]|jgi:pyruvate dehydrogenase E2 component (dihydrolipoamide acetyltransferase)|uniref:2-oxo acid dehydrogenase subunit E2 n=1 Tax=Bradyrhizobium sp. BR13661 TaxID=2940622 RepID=UPI002475565B|nr:2-oxo acid dehydrogenase subunit E2 [Bradyrhizobium sp. BR13661]MDH6257577.1 pyruvate dehydrogenase E2 component (dihydrolipoamide acetyltransferase) [Bradyrhizobium sp. BR13661]